MKHNTYFEGQVQSIGFQRNGMAATVGVIAEGSYAFNTAAAERMTVVSGALSVQLRPDSGWQWQPTGTTFEVSADSRFEVRAVGGPAAYLCEFLPRG